MSILITGGAGYIGSHTCVELLNTGHDVIVVDDLSNSNKEAINRVEQITGKKINFYEFNIIDKEALEGIFERFDIEAVIHFAGFKAVGESVKEPIKYYYNNITSTLVLCEVMKKYNVKNLVFSSSATVYGNQTEVPISEDSSLSTTNPYGSTKLMLENMLKDIYLSDSSWNIAILRYFNPVGAHKSGLIGEDPRDIPNNLMPYITQVASGRLEELSVFGNDYPTRDGTGERDYIHVVDLALGHLKALQKLRSEPGIVIYNLGTGRGYTVLEMIDALEKASGRKIKYKITDRRDGDIAVCYADTKKAEYELGWKAERGLKEICEDAWRWQLNNKNGYNED